MCLQINFSKILHQIQLREIDQSFLFICARGVMVIIVGNGHGDTSSNPG